MLSSIRRCNMKKTGVFKFISYILVILILVGVIGCIAFLTNNFTQEPATMLVQVNGQLVKGNVDSIVFDKTSPAVFRVLNLSGQGYTIQIIPEVADDLDFEFKLGDETVWFSADQSDYSSVFDITETEDGFEIDFSKCKMADILIAKYPEYVVSEVPNPTSGSYFTLVIKDKGTKSQVRIALNNILDVAVEGVELDKSEVTI